jgi:hypothetical protein
MANPENNEMRVCFRYKVSSEQITVITKPELAGRVQGIDPCNMGRGVTCTGETQHHCYFSGYPNQEM